MTTPLFESPPVEKLAKSYTGYYNSGSVNQLGHSVETRHDEHNRQESLDGLRKQQALQLQEENLLCNYLNNIAEFSKFNDIDMFDQCPAQMMGGNGLVDSQMNDNFIKCLLTSLEFLAHKWDLIDEKKYKYRFSK